MDPRTLQQCNDIMNEIRSHPVSEMFLEPVDPIRDGAPDYFKVIKKPMDLTTIQNKLDNRIYKNVQEWKDDMHLVTSNATTYNGKKSPVGAIALEVQKLFRELSHSLVDNPFFTWYNQLVDIKRDIKSHAFRKVAHVKSDSDAKTLNPKYQTKDIETNPEIHRFLINSMRKEELLILRDAILNEKRPEVMQQIQEIIRKSNLQHYKTKAINLDLLTPNALSEIKRLCKM